MTELETLAIEGIVSLVEKITTSIVASTTMSEDQKRAALAAIGSRLDSVSAKVTAVKFKEV